MRLRTFVFYLSLCMGFMFLPYVAVIEHLLGRDLFVLLDVEDY